MFVKFRILQFFCSIIFVGAFIFSVSAQSTDQNFPTAVTSNQIEGTIAARDIGDSRQTSYFYAFNGNQGDVFINVVAENFNGAIDIFNAENLQPITKIVFYATDSSNETGRVFYLRKPEKMILRVQGRTPNDDAATFQIKFAGSFAPAVALADNARPETPKVTRENESDIIVNSVGTIIGIKPKPTPSPVIEKEEIIAEKEAEKPEEPKTITEEARTEETTVAETKPEEIEPKKEETPVQVVVTDSTAEQKSAETVADKTEKETAEKVETVIEQAKEENKDKKAEDEETEKENKAKALANINLTIILKNGDKFVRPMSEIFSVNIDDGKMTVITKDGDIKRFSILEIAKTTID